MSWWRRLLRQQALERALDTELRDHLEREIEAGVRAGASEADVRRQMRLTSGGLDQIKESCRDVRRPPALADVAGDVRFAWRMLGRNKWATAGAKDRDGQALEARHRVALSRLVPSPPLAAAGAVTPCASTRSEV